jgi:hypothetical protein
MKQKIILLILMVGAALIYISQQGLYPPLSSTQSQDPIPTQVPTDRPVVVSTVPPGLNSEESITVSPTQTLEITFNMPLENVGEFKNKIEPSAEYKVELSGDRKTAKIIPATPWKLGSSYMLTITPDTKFNNNPGQQASTNRLNGDINLRFKSIEYRGI